MAVLKSLILQFPTWSKKSLKKGFFSMLYAFLVNIIHFLCRPISLVANTTEGRGKNGGADRR